MQIPIQSSTIIIHFLIQRLITIIPSQRQIIIILKIIQMPNQSSKPIIIINQKQMLMCHFIILTHEYSLEDLTISQILEESSFIFLHTKLDPIQKY